MRFGPRAAAAAPLLLAAMLLSGCGDAGTPSGQGTPTSQAAAGADAGGAVLSPTQAQQAARQWWSDHDHALAGRDAAALARLDAAPDALVVVEEVRDSIAANQPIIGQPRQPTAVRVYVPAQQTLPVPVLAVFDVGDSGGRTRHLAVLLAERSRGGPLIALETAVLDAPEPPLEVDGNGYARLIAQADQTATLGRNAADLSALFGGYMGGVANGSPQPSPAPFGDGPYTSQQAQRDATLVADVRAHKADSIGSVQLDYTATGYPVPVFALQGGGGLCIFAAQRNELLQPVQGQLFSQDASRNNYGIDLAPGRYSQITIRSIVVVAARLAGAGAPVAVLGAGGGTFSEG